MLHGCRFMISPRPAHYECAALPTELFQHELLNFCKVCTAVALFSVRDLLITNELHYQLCYTSIIKFLNFVRVLHGCRFIFSPRPAHCRSEISRTASLSLSLLHISFLRRLPSSATGSGRLLSKFAALPTEIHKRYKG